MKIISKVAVIGGTGKSGKYLVKQLIRQGFSFKILVRNPENFPINSPLVEVVKGDARDYNSVCSLISGCQAVISTLGQPKGESSIFSHATRNVIQSMNEFDVKRYVLTTGLNVDTQFDNKSPKTKFATEWMKTNYPETTSDKQEEYNILSQSKVDWTLVRLPLIEQTDSRNEISVNLEDCPGDKISATDLAEFLIGQLSDEIFIRKSPFIASV
jgi:putative NADH-flavin reductase